MSHDNSRVHRMMFGIVCVCFEREECHGGATVNYLSARVDKGVCVWFAWAPNDWDDVWNWLLCSVIRIVRLISVLCSCVYLAGANCWGTGAICLCSLDMFRWSTRSVRICLWGVKSTATARFVQRLSTTACHIILIIIGKHVWIFKWNSHINGAFTGCMCVWGGLSFIICWPHM